MNQTLNTSKYRVKAVNNTESTFDLELNQEELNGARKLAKALAGLDFCDSMDIHFDKV